MQLIKRACAIALLSGLFLFVTGAAALADTGYRPSGNLYITLNAPVSIPSAGPDTGALTFGTQEGAHAVINSTTGQRVQHAYIVITVSGKRVYLDPPVSQN